MKKIISSLAFLTFLFSVFTANAQIFTAKSGFNMAYLKGKSSNKSEKTEMVSGFHLGMMVELPIDSRFSVESGLMLNNRGAKTSYSSTNLETVYKTHMYYLDLPITGKISQPIGKHTKAFAVAGPYMALGVFGLQTTKNHH